MVITFDMFNVLLQIIQVNTSHLLIYDPYLI